MNVPAITRIKVCCIADIDEAAMAIQYGASALGLVSAMPSGPGVIDEESIARVATWAPPGIATFLLTCLQSGEAIAAQAIRCRVNTVQLCDAIGEREYAIIRREAPLLKMVQVIHVAGEESIEEARAAGAFCDAILLDSGNPTLTVKELGGTGRIHNWQISRRICETVGQPVFLAGGLRAENVAQAISTVRPFGVDICSGIRTGGRLSADKLARFAAEVRATQQFSAPEGNGPN